MFKNLGLGRILGLTAVIIVGFWFWMTWPMVMRRVLDDGRPRPAGPRGRERSNVWADDFEILSFRAVRKEFGTLWAVGEIKNGGARPGAPELEVIARDAKGELVDRTTFFPSGVRNIPPGGTSGIGFPVTRNPLAVSLEVRVVGVSEF